MNIFNAAEVIDMGIEKEKKRRDFYAKVALEFSQPEIKKLFTKLSDWETTHIDKFTQIRKSVDESEATEKYPGELKDYMNALVDDKLYQEVSPKTFRKNVKTSNEAINYGIGFEKDAILFFNELLPYMRSPHKAAIKKIIDEEKQHLIYLNQVKKTVK